jgi:RAD54-like protein 2
MQYTRYLILLLNFSLGYTPGDIENAAKTQVFFTILEESVKIGDRLLVFSQSLFTLNLLEEFLQQRKIPSTSISF